jgi:hypothetical protein
MSQQELKPKGMATIEQMLEMDHDRLLAMSDQEIFAFIKPALEAVAPIQIHSSVADDGTPATVVTFAKKTSLGEAKGFKPQQSSGPAWKAKPKKGLSDAAMNVLKRSKPEMRNFDKQLTDTAALMAQYGMEDEIDKLSAINKSTSNKSTLPTKKELENGTGPDKPIKFHL